VRDRSGEGEEERDEWEEESGNAEVVVSWESRGTCVRPRSWYEEGGPERAGCAGVSGVGDWEGEEDDDDGERERRLRWEFVRVDGVRAGERDCVRLRGEPDRDLTGPDEAGYGNTVNTSST